MLTQYDTRNTAPVAAVSATAPMVAPTLTGSLLPGYTLAGCGPAVPILTCADDAGLLVRFTATGQMGVTLDEAAPKQSALKIIVTQLDRELTRRKKENAALDAQLTELLGELPEPLQNAFIEGMKAMVDARKQGGTSEQFRAAFTAVLDANPAVIEAGLHSTSPGYAARLATIKAKEDTANV